METVAFAGEALKLFGSRTTKVSESFSKSVAGSGNVTAVPSGVVGLVIVPRNARSFTVSATDSTLKVWSTELPAALAVTVTELLPSKAAGAEMRRTPS